MVNGAKMQPFLVKILKDDIRRAERLRGRLYIHMGKKFHTVQGRKDLQNVDVLIDSLKRWLRLAENGVIDNGR